MENNLYIKPTNKRKNIQTVNESAFKFHWVPHEQGLVSHMFSDEINKLDIYPYITRMLWENKYIKKIQISSWTNLF